MLRLVLIIVVCLLSLSTRAYCRTFGVRVVEGRTTRTTDRQKKLLLVNWTFQSASTTATLCFRCMPIGPPFSRVFESSEVLPTSFFERLTSSRVRLMLVLRGSRELSFGNLKHLLAVMRFGRSDRMIQGATCDAAVLHKL